MDYSAAHFVAALTPFSVDVVSPWALLGLLILVPAVWLAYTSRSSAPRWREVAATTARCLAVVALVLALAGARMVRRSDKLSVIFVVDQSRSVAPAARADALAAVQTALRAMDENDRFALIGFAGQSALQVLPSSAGPLPTMQGEFRPGFTDIGQALRLALAVAPQDSANRIVLLSDGNDTGVEADALAAAAQARQAGAPIYVVPLAAAAQTDVWVERLLLDPQKNADEPFDVSAVVHNDSDRPRDARVMLRRRGTLVDLGGDGGKQYNKLIRLAPGTNRVQIARERIGQGGFYDYEVVIESVAASGGPQAGSRARGITRVLGPAGVLIVDGTEDMRQGKLLLEALERARVRARLGGVGEYPGSLLELKQVDCLVLSNVPADWLSPAQMELTRQWVAAGGGFVWVGGPNSYGPGRFAGTAIEEIAPVSCDVKRYIERASLALAIAIDQSGSMGASVSGGGSLTKMDLANNGAAEAVKLLDDRDEAGIVMVDTAAKWIGSPAIRRMNTPARGKLISDVLSNKPGGGGIYCRTALRAALDALAGSEAMSKHVILFADTADAEQQDGCFDLASQARRAGVTISTIGLGNPGDPDGPFLKRLAEIGGGHFHVTANPLDLPRIFVRDVQLAAANPFLEPQEGIAPTIARPSDPILTGLTGVPMLRGQVATTLKSRADLLMFGPKPEDPLLAKWRFGLGKTVAWTSDASGRWARPWVEWEGFSPFWAQVVRWAGRNPNLDSPVTAEAVIAGQEGKIVADAIDREGKPITDLNARAVVESSNPDSSLQWVELRQVAPGRYEGAFKADDAGAYIVNVVDSEGQSLDAAGAVMGFSPELNRRDVNVALLDRLAADSGGRRVDLSGAGGPGDRLTDLAALTEVFDTRLDPPPPVYTRTPISLPLVAIAATLFFADIVVRRFVLPETLLRWLTPARARQRDEAVLGQLRTRRANVRESLAPATPVMPAPAAPEHRLKDRASAPAPQPPSPAARPTEPEPPAGEGLAERLRRAKRRARDEMEDIGRS